jgi:predicted nucleic acid-binding protein
MRLYLDSCCYNRPYDDQAQEKIHMEGEAVLAIIGKSKQIDDEIIGSSALDLEIERINDIEKKVKVKYFYDQTITTKVSYSTAIFKRVQELSEQTGIRTLDRFHLAFAENANVDILLTTDNKFEKAVSKLNLKLKVINPLKYFMEDMQNEHDA